MRPRSSAAGAAAAFAVLLLGAFVAFRATRPPAEAATPAGAPLRWTLAPRPAQGPAPRHSLPPPRRDCPRSETVRLDRIGDDRRHPSTAPATLPVPAPVAVAAPDAFQVRLEPSPATPQGWGYADAMRAALAREGARAARDGGRVVWSVDHQFVARLRDGSRLAVVGGYGVTGLSFRELTPVTCQALFGLAAGSDSWIEAPGAGRLSPASARALCQSLAPAFAAWRGAARPGPLDLADLDRRRVSISSPGAGASPARRRLAEAAAESVFY